MIDKLERIQRDFLKWRQLLAFVGADRNKSESEKKEATTIINLSIYSSVIFSIYSVKHQVNLQYRVIILW